MAFSSVPLQRGDPYMTGIWNRMSKIQMGNISFGLNSVAALLTSLALTLGLTGCYTPAKERQVKNDIFAVQTRMLQLEQQLIEGNKETSQVGEVAKRTIASTSSEMERMSKDLQRTRGEIDALKIGVATGQMPGQEQSAEGSIATQLADLKERMTALEQQQADILAALEKGAKSNKAKPEEKTKGGKQGTKESAAKGSAEAATTAQLKVLFDKKKYKQVTEDGPGVIKGTKGKDKEEASFMVAESFYRMGKLRDAALQFNQFLETKPSGKNVPLANMRMGDSFRQLGDTATAKIYYEELITNFPASDEAAKAKERLAEIGGAPKGEKQGSAVKPSGPPKKVARASN